MKRQAVLLTVLGVATAATHPGTFKTVGPSASCSAVYIPGFPTVEGATTLADAEVFCVLHEKCGGVLYTEKTKAAVFCAKTSVKFSPLRVNEKCRMDQACGYLRKVKPSLIPHVIIILVNLTPAIHE